MHALAASRHRLAGFWAAHCRECQSDFPGKRPRHAGSTRPSVWPLPWQTRRAGEFRRNRSPLIFADPKAGRAPAKCREFVSLPPFLPEFWFVTRAGHRHLYRWLPQRARRLSTPGRVGKDVGNIGSARGANIIGDVRTPCDSSPHSAPLWRSSHISGSAPEAGALTGLRHAPSPITNHLLPMGPGGVEPSTF